MTAAMPAAETHQVVISHLGEYLLAIDVAHVGSIAEVDAETVAGQGMGFYDLCDLIGMPPLGGLRRMLEISDESAFVLLLTGPDVRLQELGEARPLTPPAFLDALWQDLHVLALLPTEPPALLLDIAALLRAAAPSFD